MIHIFAGDNWYALKKEADAEVGKFLNNGNDPLNVERFFGPDSELGDIKTALNSVSLFSQNKLVIVDNLSVFKDLIEDLGEFLNGVVPDTTLVILESNVDKRSSYYKTLKKMPGFKEFAELDINGFVRWVVEYAQQNQASISSNDARYLAERIGLNQSNAERELCKLISYNSQISKTSIDLLTEVTPSTTIFNLVESAFAGDLKKATRIYDEQRSLRVEPQAIFGMLVWQMHLVAICLSAKNQSATQISSDTGISSYSLSKAKTVADKMGRSKLLEIIDLMKKIEKTSKKQTYNLDDGLKFILAKLAM